jgi:hypothetical protein
VCDDHGTRPLLLDLEGKKAAGTSRVSQEILNSV